MKINGFDRRQDKVVIAVWYLVIAIVLLGAMYDLYVQIIK